MWDTLTSQLGLMCISIVVTILLIVFLPRHEKLVAHKKGVRATVICFEGGALFVIFWVEFAGLIGGIGGVALGMFHLLSSDADPNA